MVRSGASITVVGTGSWGTTLALALATQGRATMLLTRTPGEAEQLRAANEHSRVAPGVIFPAALRIESDPAIALHKCEVVLLAVPSQTMRANAEQIKPHLPSHSVILSCAKGFERGTL